MKHIIFSNYDDIYNPYYGGGAAIAIHQVAKRLAVKNNVTVFTSKYPGSINEKMDGVNYVRLGLKKAGPKLGQLIFQLLLPFYAWKMQSDFDVWFESFTPPFSTACLQLFSKKRIIGVMHNLIGKDMKKKYHLPFDIMENLGLKTYKEIIVLTNSKKKKLENFGFNGKIYIISNATDFSCELKSGGEKFILFIGRLDINQKGIDLLLDAYGKVANSVKQDLIIAGHGSITEVEKIKKIINMHKISDRVTLAGKISGNVKLEMFANADFLVLPSRFEGQGMTFLEAINCGKTVVCFDIPDLSWMEKSIAEKVPAFSVDKLASAIQKLSHNSMYVRKKEEKIRRLRSKYIFSWDQISFKYEKLFINHN